MRAQAKREAAEAVHNEELGSVTFADVSPHSTVDYALTTLQSTMVQFSGAALGALSEAGGRHDRS